MRLNERLPLFDERAQLIGGEIHAVEVGETCFASHFLDLQLDLSESVLHVVVEVGQIDLEDSVFEEVLSVLETLCAVDESLSDLSHSKECGGLDVVPVLSREGVDRLLLEALLSLGQTLVLSHSHDEKQKVKDLTT